MHSNFAVPPSKLAEQLRSAYVYTMRWYYQSKFSKYLYALEKLQIRRVDSAVLGDNKAGEYFTLFEKDSKYYTLTNRQCRLKLLRPHPFLIGLNLYSTSFQ